MLHSLLILVDSTVMKKLFVITTKDLVSMRYEKISKLLKHLEEHILII